MAKKQFLVAVLIFLKGLTKYSLGKAKKNLLVLGMSMCSMGKEKLLLLEAQFFCEGMTKFNLGKAL